MYTNHDVVERNKYDETIRVIFNPPRNAFANSLN